jgi:hypothetical protein
MDREGLLKVIEPLWEQNAQLRSMADHRLDLLKGHWGVKR